MINKFDIIAELKKMRDHFEARYNETDNTLKEISQCWDNLNYNVKEKLINRGIDFYKDFVSLDLSKAIKKDIEFIDEILKEQNKDI